MQLGIDLLSLHESHHEEKKKAETLSEAQQMFQEAKDLVRKQEDSHKQQTVETNDGDGEESRMIRRNLLLLRGRAHTNLGIVLFEMSGQNRPARHKLCREAVEEWESTLSCAHAMRARALVDRSKGGSTTEIEFDCLHADQMEVLCRRWLTSVLWTEHKPREALASFDRTKEIFQETTSAQVTDEFAESYLQLWLECYHAGTSLADLVVTDLRKPTGIRRDQEERFAPLVPALQFSQSVAKALKQMVDRSDSYGSFDDLGILNEDEIAGFIDEYTTLWKRGNASGRIQLDNKTLSRTNPFGHGDHHHQVPQRLAKEKFVVGLGTRKRRSTTQGKSATMPTSTTTTTATPEYSMQERRATRVKRHQRWGDELLSDCSTTRSGEPVSAYPACAPPKQ